MSKWSVLVSVAAIVLTIHTASAEEVLLSLPTEFSLKCDEAQRVSTAGVRDGNREKLTEFTKKNPLVFKFQNGSFTASHESVETTEPAPNLKYLSETTTTISGTLKRGVLTGKYTQYHAFSDCSDSSQPDGFLCWKCWTYGKVTGQADADGRVQVKITDWTYKAQQRNYGGKGHARGYRIFELSSWEDVTEDLQKNDSNAKTAIEFVLQLPVGQTADSSSK